MSPPASMPTARCRLAQNCLLCPKRIKVGDWMAKDFESGEWVHRTCLFTKIHAQRKT